MCFFPNIFENNQQLSQIIYDIIFIFIDLILIFLFKKLLKSKIHYFSFLLAMIKVKSPVILSYSLELLTFKDVDGIFYVTNNFLLEWGSEQFLQQNLFFGIISITIFVIFVPIFYYKILSYYEKEIRGKYHYNNLVKYNKKLKN